MVEELQKQPAEGSNRHLRHSVIRAESAPEVSAIPWPPLATHDVHGIMILAFVPRLLEIN